MHAVWAHCTAWHGLQSVAWSEPGSQEAVDPRPLSFPGRTSGVPSPAVCVLTSSDSLYTPVFQPHSTHNALSSRVSIYTFLTLLTRLPPSICCSSSQKCWMVHLLSSFLSFSSSYCHCCGSWEVLSTTCPVSPGASPLVLHLWVT